jgi:hypothetical protein
MHRSTFSGGARALLVGIFSLTAVSAAQGQSAPSAVIPASADARSLVLPAPAVELAPVQPQAAANEVAGAPVDAARDAARAARSDMMNVRRAGLSTRNQRVDSELPVPAPRQESGSTRANTALMVVGAAAIVVGAAVGDEAGAVLIVGGAAVGLLGLYRLLN